MRTIMATRIAIGSLLAATLLMFLQAYPPLYKVVSSTHWFKEMWYGLQLATELLYAFSLLVFASVVYRNLAVGKSKTNIFSALEIDSNENPYRGPGRDFGGVLYFLAICLVIAVIASVVNVVYTPLVYELPMQGWRRGATIAGILFDIFLMVFIICVSILFFNKRRNAPLMLVLFLCTQIAGYSIFVLVLAEDINTSSLAKENFHLLVRSCATGFIWIPYLLASRRVKQTFIAGPERADGGPVTETGRASIS